MLTILPLLTASFGPVTTSAVVAQQAASRVETYDVAGTERQAIIHPGDGPAPKAGRPLVLVFHGHGGTMRYSERAHNVHDLWPEATVIYPQGVPTKGMNDPDGQKNGWQKSPGAYDDRDLKFVDAILTRAEKNPGGIDPRRIYATGHSNGGRFVYVLWAARGDRFAAYGPSGTPPLRPLAGLRRASFLAIAGESDPIVAFRTQRFGVEQLARQEGADLAAAKPVGPLRLAKGTEGVEVGTYFFAGGHDYPDEALAATVALFKRTSR